VRLTVIAHQLGHADTRLTEKHYTHLAPPYVGDTVRASSLAPPSNVVPIEAAAPAQPFADDDAVLRDMQPFPENSPAILAWVHGYLGACPCIRDDVLMVCRFDRAGRGAFAVIRFGHEQELPRVAC
jgi:hypothetical protein